MNQPKKKQGMQISPQLIIGALIVILALYFISTSFGSGVTTVTNAQTLAFPANSTQLVRVYNGSTIAIKLQMSSATGAAFYVTRLPILYGPVSVFYLTPGASVNVSSNGTTVADMNLKLVSTAPNGATLTIAPFLSNFGIRTSSSVHLANPVTFGSATSGNALVVNTILTTTIPSTTITLKTTTTINASQSTLQKALSLMNTTSIAILMKKYNVLYGKDVNCTSSLYNSTYTTYRGSAPPAPLSFANVSPNTPTAIAVSENQSATKNNVLITYSTVAPSKGASGPAILALVNVSASAFLRSTSFVGTYAGLNYTILNKSYNYQKQVSGACAAFIPPS